MRRVWLGALLGAVMAASGAHAGDGAPGFADHEGARPILAQYGRLQEDGYGNFRENGGGNTDGRPAAPGTAGRYAQAGAEGGFLSYHGFKLDLSEATQGGNVSNAVASAEHQIDIVDRAGLSGGALQLFRGLPIKISGRPFGGGHFSGGSEVEIAGAAVSDNRPILLHEYMHAFHYYQLPGGFGNPDILRFYNEAASSGLYEQGSYMMSSPGEFFAVTASCFLNGTVAREPYNRSNIRARQPDYYAYLARLFGRGA